MHIKKGQRLKLDEIVPNNSPFLLQGTCSSKDITLDFACFGLDSAGLLSDDRYMTFFNQPSTPCGSVILQDSTTDNTATFGFDLKKLPDTIERLVLTVAIDGQATLHAIHSGAVSVQVQGKTVAQFSFTGSDFQQERAVMLVEKNTPASSGIWWASSSTKACAPGRISPKPSCLIARSANSRW